jgi:hypothetical protein
VSRFVSLASELGVSANTFEAGFNDSVTDQATRISFKARTSPYACLSFSVAEFHRIFYAKNISWMFINWDHCCGLVQYGCSRGVVGTPTYLVNGVNVAGADDSWSVDDWAKIFDPIVKATGLGMTYPSS